MKKLIIHGSGGHAGVVIASIYSLRRLTNDGFEIVGLMDPTLERGVRRHGFEVNRISPNDLATSEHFVAIGDPVIRKKCLDPSLRYANVHDPSANYYGNFDCKGSYFGAFAFVGNGSRVGDFCIINTRATLEHDSSIGDFSHMAPGSITGGRVTIGHHTFIGLGAMIRDGVTIGSNCTIGMGSVVLDDVPDNCTGYGNPFKIHGNR